MTYNKENTLSGALIRLKNGSVGVIVDVENEFEKVWAGDFEASLYKAYVSGSFVLLIREAFDLL